jgi:exopolysaccharide biosynthesis protein
MRALEHLHPIQNVSAVVVCRTVVQKPHSFTDLFHTRVVKFNEIFPQSRESRKAEIMKKIFVLILVHLWLVILFASTNAQDFKTMRDGIEYAELEKAIGEKPVRMNLLRLDLTKVRLDVVHAMDAAIGLEKTSSIAARHGAFAAINAGFFRLDTSIFAGDAAGVLKIDGEILSESFNNRSALLIENGKKSTTVNFYQLTMSRIAMVGKRKIDISGINRERKNDDLVLFTPAFNRTTLTDKQGVEIVIKRRRVVKILENQGSTEIPRNGFVLSASGKFREQILSLLKTNSKIEIMDYISTPEQKAAVDADLAEDIVAGVPQLIKNGKIDITWEREKSSKAFVETRHPRTAVAKLKDGKFLMITVDGRSEASAGIGLEDLARLLLEFGAVDAMNLDGGGSTTMFLDGKIVNRPSDKEGERRVSDAILVFPRKKN